MISVRYFLAFSFLFFANPPSSAERYPDDFAFALLGDTPYGVPVGKKSREFDVLVTDVNSHSLSWVMHVGDIKSGGSKCSDAMLIDRSERFAKFSAPIILTPGDNEWTDCHRVAAGGYDPLERLAFLRKIFYLQPKHEELRARMNISTQSQTEEKYQALIENYIWEKNGVVFSTIHIVGSLNGAEDFSALSKVKRGKVHKKEQSLREKAAIQWLRQTFRKAKENSAKAVFIAIHANAAFDHRAGEKERNAFAFFHFELAKLLHGIQMPVVLAHGDSHTFQINKPYIDNRPSPKNFLRIETFGDTNDDWIKVDVKPNTKNVFSFSVMEN